MKYAIGSAMVYLAVILQTTLLPRLGFLGAQPDLLCAAAVAIAIAAGPVVGGIMGASAGLALDLMFMQPGFYSLQYLAICLIAGLAAQRIPFGRVILPAVACFVCFFLKELVSLMYLYLSRVEINFAVAMAKLLLSAAFTVALHIPLHQAVRAVWNLRLTQERSVFGNDRR